ncbi:MAG: PEGA domain-containing protein [Myxococcales bacterium]|nr:PEGA domain-containing protein [Myxococcales bacterium]
MSDGGQVLRTVPVHSSAPPRSELGTATDGAVTRSMPSGEPGAPRRGRGALIGLAAGSAVAAGGVLYFVTRAPAGPASEAPATAAAAASAPATVPAPVESTARGAPASPAPPGAEIELRVDATPATAKIYLDGKLLDGNPATFRTRAADGEHEVRAEADGYEAKTRRVALDRSRTLDLELTKTDGKVKSSEPWRPGTGVPQPPKTAAADTATAPTATTTQPPPPEEVLKAGGTATRTIDEDNPYAKPK